MQVDFSSNYFEFFQLPVQFDIQLDDLVLRFRELQKQLHPDKFAAKPESERRWSMQAASFVNEGYQTLENDLRRASYLLQLNGVSIDEETDTQMAPDFLMQQMELRESLEQAQSASDPVSKLDDLKTLINSGVAEQTAVFEKAAERHDWPTARTVVRQWQFLDKLLLEAKLVEERLDI